MTGTSEQLGSSPAKPAAAVAVGRKSSGPGAILILGATSAIARALAHQFGRWGKNLIVASREAEELAAIASDLHLRYGVGATPLRFDALDFSSHADFFTQAASLYPGGLEGVILCYGLLGDQLESQADADLCRQIIDVNFTSAVSLLELAAAYFESRQKSRGVGASGRPAPFICAISSVAGDRGRQSNYLYGAAKGGLTTYLQGLRNRLAGTNIPVLTVKPGFVDTSMTWGLLKPNSPLVASPQKVAADIARAIRKRKNILYTPWFWRHIMTIIKSIPEPIFKRLKL